MPSSRASTASTMPAQPLHPRPSRPDRKVPPKGDKADFKDKLALLKALSSTTSAASASSSSLASQTDAVGAGREVAPRPGKAALEVETSRTETGQEEEQQQEEKEEEDFFTSVVPSHVAGGTVGEGESAQERAAREGVVTESIWSNMWAGGVRASVETARASYSQARACGHWRN